MNISEALIEKYHKGLCSPEEELAIENWLENGDEDTFEFPHEVSVKDIKAEVWTQLHDEVVSRPARLRSRIWKFSSAAAAVVAITTGLLYLKNQPAEIGKETEIVAVHQTGHTPQTEALQIEFGSESGAVYSQEKQTLDFFGVVKITPKKNMKLSFTSLCDGNRETVRDIDVKGGTTYFAMDVKHQNSSELVIMDKDLVGELPPILQNSLIAQFGI